MQHLPSGQLLRPMIVVASLLASWASSAQAQTSGVESYGGREMIIHVPPQPLPAGSRPLVVVLHGGLGNAERIASRRSEVGLNMDAVADRNGFVVVYLNGTPVTRLLGDRALGWNAGGGCCGLSAQNAIDDVGYIQGAVHYLVGRYGIDPTRVYGTGHSNGAMMTERLVCETNLYAAAVAISGPLNLDNANCPAARGKRILAIHGVDDQNVPLAGGRGPKGLANVAFKSEDSARQVFTASGASYTLQPVPSADHRLDIIEAAIVRTEGVGIAEKSARFFGIVKPKP